MKKINWKEEMKKSLNSFATDMWQFLCLLLAIAFVVLTQTEKQIQYIITFFIEKDWIIIAIFIVGIVCIGVIVEKLLKLIWRILKFIFNKIKEV